MSDLIAAVALDGPAGAGKSTIARAVAERLGFLYVDTGAMYRAVTLAARRRGIKLEDEATLGQVAESVNIDFSADGTRVFLDGADVTREIRDPELTTQVRYAARAPAVRQVLVRRQQELAAQRPVVMEGRDITTVVLARAKWKFFLTAAPEERARRRVNELRQAGHAADYPEILAQIVERDQSDRQVGALKNADELSQQPQGGIRRLDTTSLKPEEVVERIITVVRAG